MSKVLSGSSEISRETAERILKIAEENGVRRPNYHKARAHSRVAILIPEIISVYYSQVATALIDELRRYGVEPYMYLCGFDDESFCRIVNMLSEEKLADGILTLGVSDYTSFCEIPIVGFGMSQSYPRFDALGSDMQSGMYEALEYLHSLGHTSIGFISEKHTDAKLRYFKSAMSRLDCRCARNTVHKPQAFRRNRVRRRRILYETDISADRAGRGIRRGRARSDTYIQKERNIRAGGRLGDRYQRHTVSSYSSVPLTTIRTFSNELIERAVKLLLDRIKSPERHIVQHIMIKCELIVRDTTAKAKPHT